jgi:hypothetical protein
MHFAGGLPKVSVGSKYFTQFFEQRAYVDVQIKRHQYRQALFDIDESNF